ncbi:MAG: hypothetical protein COB49_11930 [Alphaproteobacteria bacterium]|nr:MAG: hypothetical protein COB49_11930 [Alphaproteobacteria bacterium]
MTGLREKFIRWLKRIRFKIWLYFVVKIRPLFRVGLQMFLPELGKEETEGFWQWAKWLGRFAFSLFCAAILSFFKMLYQFRPLTLLIMAAMTLFIIFYWLGGINSIENFEKFQTEIEKIIADPSQWKQIGTQLFLLLATPILFLLWYWRDHNVRADLKNKRKDTNLKDFQETQMRAAGAIEGNFKPELKLTLQIAALHQLRAFLRGDHGESFRRPAYELFRAQLSASAINMGHDQTTHWLKHLNSKRLENEKKNYNITQTMNLTTIEEPNKKWYEEVPGPLQQAERQILAEDWKEILSSGFPLAELQIPGINFPNSIVLAGQNLAGVNLRGAKLQKAHLEGVDLQWAHLEKADLTYAYLEGANLRDARLHEATLIDAHLEGADLGHAFFPRSTLYKAHLEGASLAWADFTGAILNFTHFEGANLNRAFFMDAIVNMANFEGADLRGLHVNGNTNFEGSVYDDETQFGIEDKSRNIINPDEACKNLRALGLRHVNEKVEE